MLIKLFGNKIKDARIPQQVVDLDWNENPDEIYLREDNYSKSNVLDALDNNLWGDNYFIFLNVNNILKPVYIFKAHHMYKIYYLEDSGLCLYDPEASEVEPQDFVVYHGSAEREN